MNPTTTTQPTQDATAALTAALRLGHRLSGNLHATTPELVAEVLSSTTDPRRPRFEQIARGWKDAIAARLNNSETRHAERWILWTAYETIAKVSR